jgi:hypothetical protein
MALLNYYPTDTQIVEEVDAATGAKSYYLIYSLSKDLVPEGMTYRYKVNNLSEISDTAGVVKPNIVINNDNGEYSIVSGKLNNITLDDYSNSFYFGTHTQLRSVYSALEIGEAEAGAESYDYLIQALNYEAKDAPWLLSQDGKGRYDYLAVVFEAAIEGRTARESDLRKTTWWKTHDATERAAIKLKHQDPAAYSKNAMTTRQSVIQKMVDAGIQTLDPGLIDKIVEQKQLGKITDSDLELTISKLANPRIRYELNTEIKAALEGKTLEVIEQTKAIENTITAILGPGIADKFNLDDLANRYAANPIWFQEEFLPSLQDQFQSKYSQYKGTNVKSYEDIAPEYRGEWEGVTGQLPDETSAAWRQFLATNDIAERRDIAFAEAAKLGTQTYRDYVKRDMEVKFGKAGQRAVGGGRFQ